MNYEEESGDIEFAFTGDWFISRRLSIYREERFLKMVDILRQGDVTFGNAETLFHNFEISAHPRPGPNGTYAQCDPDFIEDMKWAGLDMVSTANNHAANYGEAGVLASIKNLDEHRLPHAGTGRNLTEAVAPAYLDTPKGSVALIAVTLTPTSGEDRASDAHGANVGRAGPNVLRHRTVNTVPSHVLETLKEIGTSLEIGREFEPEATSVGFLGQRFVAGEQYKKETTAHEFDLELNLASVRNARRMADWVVVSMHNHERGASLDEPAQFAIEFARSCIDAGADVIFGHGPHRERGIEIYNGKPIIYALGDFVLHNELIKWQPLDLYDRFAMSPDQTVADIYDRRYNGETTGMVADRLNYQTAIVTVRFADHGLTELEIHPVDLGYDTGKRSQRGRPILATGEVAGAVLERLRRLSAPFGTEVEIEGERGLIRVG